MMSTKRSRLTDLHENELSHILSRLPTKEVVRTSILSKDWRFKWSCSCTVDIAGYYLFESPLFINFVNRVLYIILRCTRFRLECDIDDLNLRQAWINNALWHNLESLDLKFVDRNTLRPRNIVLPTALLNSTCLRELKLCLSGTLNVATNNFATKLTSLNLSGVDIVNGDNTSTTLKFTFPLLETFSAKDYSWSNVTSVEIDAPSLTTFASWPIRSDGNYLFVILSHRIATISCHIRLWEKFIMNTSSIVTAYLHCEDKPGFSLSGVGPRLREMVNEFTNLQALGLSGQHLHEVLPSLPRHDKLRKLDLIKSRITVEQLLEILTKTPSLKELRLNMYQWFDYDYGAIDSVPSCIVSHLEEVYISKFKCETPQYNLLKFLLMNGEKLKKLIMLYVPRITRHEVEEFVLALPISHPVLIVLSHAYDMLL